MDDDITDYLAELGQPASIGGRSIQVLLDANPATPDLAGIRVVDSVVTASVDAAAVSSADRGSVVVLPDGRSYRVTTVGAAQDGLRRLELERA